MLAIKFCVSMALANIWFVFNIVQQRFPVMVGTIDKAPIYMAFKEVNVRRTKNQESMLSYISYRSTLSSLEYFKDSNAGHQGLCIYVKAFFDKKMSTILPTLLALANCFFFFLISQQHYP
jgi:hypothetical protein